MYQIQRVKSDRENMWLLQIDGSTVGHAESVALTDSHTSIVATLEVKDTDHNIIRHSYNCFDDKSGRTMSILQFTKEAIDMIGDTELRLVPDETPDHYPNIVIVPQDVTVDNAIELAEYCKLGTYTDGAVAKDAVLAYLKDNLEKATDNAMADLLHRAKFGHARGTKISMHEKYLLK